MGLLTDFYNTVAKFFRPQEENGDEASKSVATNRLKLVLMQDRTNLTPKILEQMRGELVDLLSKYLEMDKELLELNFEQEGDQVALMLSIPVIRAKDEEEIEKAIAEANEKKVEEDTDQDSDENITDEDESESEASEQKEELTETITESEEETGLNAEDTTESDTEKECKHSKKDTEEIPEETNV